jgi:hypothetical protein
MKTDPMITRRVDGYSDWLPDPKQLESQKTYTLGRRL